MIRYGGPRKRDWVAFWNEHQQLMLESKTVASASKSGEKGWSPGCIEKVGKDRDKHFDERKNTPGDVAKVSLKTGVRSHVDPNGDFDGASSHAFLWTYVPGKPTRAYSMDGDGAKITKSIRGNIGPRGRRGVTEHHRTACLQGRLEIVPQVQNLQHSLKNPS